MQLAASEAREEKLAEELSNARQLLRMVRQQWQPQTWFVCLLGVLCGSTILLLLVACAKLVL